LSLVHQLDQYILAIFERSCCCFGVAIERKFFPSSLRMPLIAVGRSTVRARAIIIKFPFGQKFEPESLMAEKN
jgi:hypothetical protein